MSGTDQLSTTNKLLISPDGITYFPADTGFAYSGNATSNETINLPFYVKQTISEDEIPGVFTIFTITISFTASLP
jgi:hypothetical protein